MHSNFRFPYLVAVLMVTSLTGCSSGPGDTPDLAAVSGTVTMDGKPLSGVVVTFQPTDGGRSSRGETDSDGQYKLYYGTENSGAQLGSHQVLITAPPPSDDTMDLQSQDIPAKYNTATELTAEVKAGSNTVDFPLTSGK